jgi:hypothetical protein
MLKSISWRHCGKFEEIATRPFMMYLQMNLAAVGRIVRWLQVVRPEGLEPATF